MVAWLSGKKVYILAILGAIGGLVEFIAHGDFSLTAIMALGTTAWGMALIAAIRAAITKSAPEVK